jgi:uncharacterized membrane protein YkoI
MKKLLLIGIAALMLAMGAVVTCYAKSEEKTTLDKVSAAVRATIEKQAEGGKIEEIEVVKEDDKSIYEVKIEKGDKITEYKIDATGKVLGKEDADDEDAKAEKAEKDAKAAIDKAPKEVQATVKKLLGEGEVVGFALESDGNYELDYEIKDVAQSAIIAPSGKILESEVTVEASKLPKAVTDAVKKLYPKGKIKLAETLTKEGRMVYELSVAVEVTISPEGKVQDEEPSTGKPTESKGK